jgi:hypothetical protein
MSWTRDKPPEQVKRGCGSPSPVRVACSAGINWQAIESQRSWTRRIQGVSASHEMILCDERRLECEVRN